MSTRHDPRLDSIRHELQLTSDLLLVSVRMAKALLSAGVNPSGHPHPGVMVVNCGVANLPPTFRTDVANKLLSLTEQYRALWLSRYHAPGMHACLRVINNLLRAVIPEGTSKPL